MQWYDKRLIGSVAILIMFVAAMAVLAAGWGKGTADSGPPGSVESAEGMVKDTPTASATVDTAPGKSASIPSGVTPDQSPGMGPKTAVMRVRGQEVPLFPEDPISAFSGLTWRYPCPAHVVACSYDAASRTLMITICLQAPQSACDYACQQLAAEYRLHGRPDVDWRDIRLQRLPLLGYRVTLRREGQTVLLGQYLPVKDQTVLAGDIRVSCTVPETNTALIEEMVSRRDYVGLDVQTIYDTKEFLTDGARVEMLQSSVQSVVEEITHSNEPTIIVDRPVLQKVGQALTHKLRFTTWGNGGDTDKQMKLLAERIDPQLERMAPPLTPQELMDLPNRFLFYGVPEGKEDVQPEHYDRVTRAASESFKSEEDLKTFGRAIREKTEFNSGEQSFYHSLQTALKGEHKGKVSVFGSFLGIDGSWLLDKQHHELNQDQQKSVHNAMERMLNEHSLEQHLLTEWKKTFEGEDRKKGVNSRPLSLHRLTSANIAARLLIDHTNLKVMGSHQVSYLAVLPLQVAPKDDPVEKDEVLKPLLTRLRKQEEALVELKKRVTTPGQKTITIATSKEWNKEDYVCPVGGHSGPISLDFPAAVKRIVWIDSPELPRWIDKDQRPAGCHLSGTISRDNPKRVVVEMTADAFPNPAVAPYTRFKVTVNVDLQAD